MNTYLLYGSIGSGKSTLGKALVSPEIKIIELDAINKNILDNNQNIIKEIAAVAPACLLDNQFIDKSILKKLIFSDLSIRIAVESVMHPEIIKAAIDELNSKERYKVIISPLVSKIIKKIDFKKIVYLQIDKKNQIKRVQSRDSIDEIMINNIINIQNEDYKNIHNDLIIDGLINIETQKKQFLELIND